MFFKLFSDLCFVDCRKIINYEAGPEKTCGFYVVWPDRAKCDQGQLLPLGRLLQIQDGGKFWQSTVLINLPDELFIENLKNL